MLQVFPLFRFVIGGLTGKAGCCDSQQEQISSIMMFND